MVPVSHACQCSCVLNRHRLDFFAEETEAARTKDAHDQRHLACAESEYTALRFSRLFRSRIESFGRQSIFVRFVGCEFAIRAPPGVRQSDLLIALMTSPEAAETGSIRSAERTKERRVYAGGTQSGLPVS